MLFQQQLRLIGSFGCRMENMADAMQKMSKGLVHPVVDSQVEFGDVATALERYESNFRVDNWRTKTKRNQREEIASHRINNR